MRTDSSISLLQKPLQTCVLHSPDGPDVPVGLPVQNVSVQPALSSLFSCCLLKAQLSLANCMTENNK